MTENDATGAGYLEVLANSGENRMTIYEIDGVKYAGARKVEIKSHPWFLGFVRLCVDNHEYSLSSDDLMRAIDRAITRPPAPEDEALGGGAADLINQFAEEQASRKRAESTELPPR